jgi:hypothetical protein
MTTDRKTLIYRLYTRLDYLKNLFLLDRLLLRRGHYLDATLVSVSVELVSMVVLLWTDRERFMQDKDDFEWMVSRVTPFSLPQALMKICS